uniref:Uncharacterized protein n=1 Tax=Rhizophagus irregularis (strain DAOM 181602 / DAOM 197198 / MUCL 43194) TaxID=747089 RepID=U9T1V1_RHIID
MGIGSPYDIRNQVMDDLIKAYSSTFASGIKRFTMRIKALRSKKMSTLFCGSHLVMNRLSEFYLCIPRPLELQTENQGPFIMVILHHEVMETLEEFIIYVMLTIKYKNMKLIRRLHRKLAKWLCSNHRIVLLPEFQIQVSAVFSLNYPEPCAHGVIIVLSIFTSQINDKLGGSKTFKCEGYSICDINGARNILLSFLTIII